MLMKDLTREKRTSDNDVCFNMSAEYLPHAVQNGKKMLLKGRKKMCVWDDSPIFMTGENVIKSMSQVFFSL